MPPTRSVCYYCPPHENSSKHLVVFEIEVPSMVIWRKLCCVSRPTYTRFVLRLLQPASVYIYIFLPPPCVSVCRQIWRS